jgi:PAS domain S-box-containing protein
MTRTQPVQRPASSPGALLDYLTRPSPRLPEEMQGRSRLLAALLLIATPVMLWVSTWAWMGTPLQALLITSVVLLPPAYLLNRAGYFQAGAWLSILYLGALPFLYLITLEIDSFEAVSFAAVWLLAPMFVTYILLELRALILMVLSVAAAIFFILIFNPHVTLAYLSTGLLFLAWSTVLLLISGLLRQRETHERRAQSQALVESESRYRTVFNAALEGIIIHQNGRVITCNPAFAHLLGYDEREISGMDALAFYAPEERERAVQLMQSVEPYQTQGIRKDGTRFWAEVHGRPIMLDGQCVRVATVSDISARKGAEQQQLSLALEQEKVKLLQRFITSISHDLRTPLSTINTGLYLIERLKDDPDRFQQQIASVQAQVQHLDRLINDLLSMSRLDRRKTADYRFALHPVNDLVRAVVNDLSPQALDKRQTLTFCGADDLPRTLADEAELRRMFQHILQNAISFTPEGGKVDVTTALQGDDILIQVRDTGIGISSEDRGQIFDYFYRGDTARNPDTGGVGLGLTIARRICQAHNGRIEVESTPGAGSTFSIYLPVTRYIPASSPLLKR